MKRIIMLLLACCLLVGAAAAAGGSGTAANPYIIENPAELQSIQNNLAAYYVLGNDIDMSDYSFTPIGSTSAPFTGSLNGNGYTISNLLTNRAFIDVLASGAIIKNINLEDWKVTSTNPYTGCLIGRVVHTSNTASTLQNINMLRCSITSSEIYGGILCGGIEDNVNILNCVFTDCIANIDSNYDCGIICGVINGGYTVNVESCIINNSRITTAGIDGLVCGYLINNCNLIIRDCTANSCIIGIAGSYHGIICGAIASSSSVSIDNCIVKNCISRGNTNIGGITGGAANSDVDISISNCDISESTIYAYGAAAGGITGGAANVDIDNCVVKDCSILASSIAAGIYPNSAAASITGCTVENTNIYSSTVYDIGPDGSYDSTSTATGITNVANRYLYASGLSADVSGATAAYTLESRQGSTTVEAEQGTAQSWAWTFGDGQTSTAAQDTTHTYAAPGFYTTQLQLTNYLDSTGVTVSDEVTILPGVPTVTDPTASPTIGPLSQEITLQASVSAEAQNYFPLTYQWQEYASGSWIDVSGATTNPATIQISDGAATLHRFRLAVTNAGGTAFSGEVTYQSVAPPVFSSFEVSPLSGGIPLTVTFSAAASDTSGYRWEYSTDGTIWVQMASGASGSYTFTSEGVYYVRATATGTGGTTISSAATVTASNLLPEFTSVSVSPEAGVAPFTVSLSATATNGATFVWERQSGSSWVQVGTGASISYPVAAGTPDGVLRFRAIANNQYGSVTSAVVSVEVGSAPLAEIAAPSAGSVFGSGRSVGFTAADAGPGVSYSWDFGDGLTGSGRTVTHSYGDVGAYEVTLTTSSRFGSSVDIIRIEIVEATGDIWLAVSDVSTTGATLQATVEVSPVAAGTVVWFEVSSSSGQVVLRSGKIPYTGVVSWDASGLPLIAGQTYRATAYSNNYGYSLPQMFTLVSAVSGEHEQLGTEWEGGLFRNPFDVSSLLSSGIATYGKVMGGGSVGAAVAFGTIALFVIVGLWLRQQSVVIPVVLVLVGGWFVIGNLPGDWQPIAYTLMVVSVVAIFFYLFRKRIE